MNLLALFARLREPAITAESIRSEIFFLGSRHQGEPLRGALEELKSAGLPPRRTRLLRAVVQQLTRLKRPASTPVVVPVR